MDRDMAIDYARARLVEDVWQLMKSQGVSRKELARRLGTTERYVSYVLGERAAFTLERMVELALALGGEAEIRIREKNYGED